MSSWAELLRQAEPRQHVVQLYGEDDQLLSRNVSRYLGEGLAQGDGCLVIATAGHTEAITRQLGEDGHDPASPIRSGQLLMLDAQATLARFMVDGQPDWQRFEQVVAGAMDQVRAVTGPRPLRAFGEMVGLLWAGQPAAARQLEDYWNRFRESKAFSLFCAYPIDGFGDELPSTALGDLLRTHTHVLLGPRTMLSSAG